ncbi:MAG TPA: multiheme c-type cytochrome [Verrucomicrobiae bacterium]|nr:multiheme c-type cytochrome [Verrucomicrobiae bacterium]
MSRKPLSFLLLNFRLLAVIATWGFLAVRGGAAEPARSGGTAKFLGATSCGTSGCHGGGGKNQNQYLVWWTRDAHSQRSFATLTTARSKQIADALRIKEPTTDTRCASCHSPSHEVPEALRAEAFKSSGGVSCESCHGPAESWLRSHTRPDWTHADRVFAGMRDLKNLYVRANTCVACHQTVATPLLKAGHPELIFELDGQCVSQPRHWREKTNWNGGQAWLIGQAVALREMSWQLSREAEPDEKLMARWSALLWLLQKLEGLDGTFPAFSKIPGEPASQNFLATLKAGDELAQRVSAFPWTDEMSRKALKTLASTGNDFRQPGTATHFQARRAERLALALDRLLVSCKDIPPASSADANLGRLFKQVQSLPEFNASGFADALNQVSHSLEE